MTRSSNAVFLSYTSEDMAAAQRICAALRTAGVEVWFDQDELRGGDAWDQKIRRQIHECGLFIAIVSAHSNAREEGYFRREWRLAVERTHDLADDAAFLLPVAIDDSQESTARVPERFRSVQWTHLPAGDIPAAFVEHVTGLLSPQQSTRAGRSQSAPQPILPTSTNAASASPPHRHSLFDYRFTIPVLAIVVLATLGFVAVVRWVHAPAKPVVAATALPAGNSAAAVTVPGKSIAVLPFVDMSEKHDQEYFSDGLTEELINHLAHAQDLKVTSRTSSFQFKGKNDDVHSIAEKLKVAHVLEGSVRKSGNELRITAQLIRTADDTHLWSQTYDRALKDIFKLQDEIATTVSTALQVAMRPAATARAAATTNMEAYGLLLKGNYFFTRGNSGDSAEAIAQYLQALRLEPDYALALAKLARTYMGQALWGEVPATAVAEQARQAAQRALAIDPNSAQAHYALGQVHYYYDYEWKLARADFERAIALDPHGEDSNDARENIAELTVNETEKEPTELYLQHVAKDPLNTLTLIALAQVQYFAGQFENSAATSKRLLGINPDYALGRGQLALTLLMTGKAADALANAQLESDEAFRLATLACAHWSLGHKGESAQAMSTLETRYSKTTAYFIAGAHAWRGETVAALAWLDRAYDQHDSNLVYVKRDPLLRGLHGEQRFHALLVKMKLPD